MQTNHLVIGVDGGASTTRCIASDLAGNIVAKNKTGPSDHIYDDRGQKKLKKTLSMVLHPMLERLNKKASFEAICLGMTAVKRCSPESKIVEDEVMTIFSERKIAIPRILVVEDAVIAWAGATACQPGVMVYAGTGSIAYGVNQQGQECRAGGWGYVIDDEGSAYDIGKRALKAVFRNIDGRVGDTSLSNKLKEYFNKSTPEEIQKEVYISHTLGRSKVAALAKIVSQAAFEGDEIAISILNEAGKELGLLAEAVITRLFLENGRFPVVTAGGVFNTGVFVHKPFEIVVKKTSPKAEIVQARFEPVVGAVLLAFRLMGLPLTGQRLSNLGRDL